MRTDANGWREIASDPPPFDQPILGLCSYTGVRSVTARKDDVRHLSWANWYMNHPTHWQELPDALPLTEQPVTDNFIVGGRL